MICIHLIYLICVLLFFVDTIEKARKIAEDSQYSSTDEAELGKGFRKHIPAKKYLNTSPSKDTSDDESNEEIATSNCVKNKKTTLPSIPSFPLQYYNNSKSENIRKSIRSSYSNDFGASNKREKSTTSFILRCNENNNEEDIFSILKRLEG